MYKISIIIPIYNTEPYLKKALAGIAAQTYRNIEVICVDDGSTDHCANIIKSFIKKDRRFMLLTQPHSGAGAARNTGLAAATGDYILFLDGDDIFDRDLCRLALGKAKKTGADIVIFGSRGFDNRDKKTHSLGHLHFNGFLDDHRVTKGLQSRNDHRKVFGNQKEKGSPHTFDPRDFSYKDIPDHIFNAFGSEAWNKLYSHEFIKKRGLRFQEIMRTNDLLFVFKSLILADKISLENKVLIHYRTGVPGSCQNTTSAYPLDFYKAYRALKGFLDEQSIYGDVKRSFVNYCIKGCYHNIISQSEPGKMSMVYRFLHETGFPELGFKKEDKSYFYDINDYRYYDAILNDTLCEVFYNETRSVLNSRRYKLGAAILSPVKKFLKGFSL